MKKSDVESLESLCEMCSQGSPAKSLAGLGMVLAEASTRLQGERLLLDADIVRIGRNDYI